MHWHCLVRVARSLGEAAERPRRRLAFRSPASWECACATVAARTRRTPRAKRRTYPTSRCASESAPKYAFVRSQMNPDRPMGLTRGRAEFNRACNHFCLPSGRSFSRSLGKAIRSIRKGRMAIANMLSSFICAQNNTATKILFSTNSSHAPAEVMISSRALAPYRRAGDVPNPKSIVMICQDSSFLSITS